jgi:hypothetical protein
MTPLLVRMLARATDAALALQEIIELAIDQLDNVDGDPDLEDDEREFQGDFEPSLGSIDHDDQRGWSAGGEKDAEIEDE